MVTCGLECDWPYDPGCAQACYEAGTSQAQRRLEAIQTCAVMQGCGADPECIQSACDPEVSLCMGGL